MSCAIGVRDLHVKYRAKNGKWVHAVQGLSFEVKPGEVVGFLGPNGAGKSSTLKALMGFVQPESGECEVFGLAAGSLEAKKQCGYLPEVALYYPYLTPLETMRLYGELQGLRGKALLNESEELLELVGLQNSMTKQNRQLSKGMLQRVGIAQSLLGNPDLLILDEVTSGLDPIGRKELRNLLKDRQKQGSTLFFSSHELSEVEMLCDRLLLIHQGKLIEERDINELKNELRQFSVSFTGNASLIDLTQQISSEPEGWNTAHFDTKEGLIEAISRVQGSGGQIKDIVSQEGSLEDYFVETIGRAA
ncbi:MAG: ABC transporter ATP-binding protein [Fimbriimonadaceae bacterium]|nr:ABC transporter ATP-binding protein [Fimbriimonadaceae bacterium]